MFNIKFVMRIFALTLMLSLVPLASSHAYEDETNYNEEAIASGGVLFNADGKTTGTQSTTVDAGSGAGGSESFSMGGCSGNVFDILTCKAAKTLSDLRVLVYILAGFGLIAFAYAAIFNKISFKHLSQIGIGLFLVACMGPFIEYFTHDGGGTGTKLKFGSYIPTDFKAIVGSDDLTEKECVKNASGNCTAPGMEALAAGSLGVEGAKASDVKINPIDIAYDPSTGKKSFSIKDAVNAAKKAYQAYDTAKSTVNAVKKNVDRIGRAIELGSSGNIGDILNAASSASVAFENISDAAKSGGKSIAASASQAANSAQDAWATKQERQVNEYQRATGNQTNKISDWIAKSSDRDKGKNNTGDSKATQNRKKVDEARGIYNDVKGIYDGVAGKK